MKVSLNSTKSITNLSTPLESMHSPKSSAFFPPFKPGLKNASILQGSKHSDSSPHLLKIEEAYQYLKLRHVGCPKKQAISLASKCKINKNNCSTNLPEVFKEKIKNIIDENKYRYFTSRDEEVNFGCLNKALKEISNKREKAELTKAKRELNLKLHNRGKNIDRNSIRYIKMSLINFEKQLKDRSKNYNGLSVKAFPGLADSREVFDVRNLSDQLSREELKEVRDSNGGFESSYIDTAVVEKRMRGRVNTFRCMKDQEKKEAGSKKFKLLMGDKRNIENNEGAIN